MPATRRSIRDRRPEHRSLPPVIFMAAADSGALGRIGELRKARGRKGHSRKTLWLVTLVALARGWSWRAAARELTRDGESRELCGVRGEPPSRDTIRRFADLAGAEQELAYWMDAARAHGVLLSHLPEEFVALSRTWTAAGLRDLLGKLDRRGKPGRTGWPAEVKLRMLVAQAGLGYGMYTDFLAEVDRNPVLAAWCGLPPGRRPSLPTYARFVRRVAAKSSLIVDASAGRLAELSRWLPELGGHAAADRTFIDTWANVRRGQADKDARKGFATKNRGRGKTEFDLGYAANLLACGMTGLPLYMVFTPANERETNLLPSLVSGALERAPWMRPAFISGDAGYDSRANSEFACSVGAAPAIPVRKMPKSEYVAGPGGERLLPDGTPLCGCGAEMASVGHAKAAGPEPGMQLWDCPAACGAERLELDWTIDPRRTPPRPRCSDEYREACRRHQAVERLHSILKSTSRFLSGHCVRGKANIRFRVTFSILMMLARALAACRDGRPGDIRKVKRRIT